MSEPTSGPQSRQVRDAELTTGVMRGMDQLDSLNAGVEPHSVDLIDEFPPQPYVKERLFSRKVLVGWAAATLIVWFVLTMIFPVVLETVGDEIRSNMTEPQTNTGAPVIDPMPPVPPAPVTPPAPVEPTQAPDQVRR